MSAFPTGTPNELELYLRKMNEGQKLTAPNIRH